MRGGDEDAHLPDVDPQARVALQVRGRHARPASPSTCVATRRTSCDPPLRLVADDGVARAPRAPARRRPIHVDAVGEPLDPVARAAAASAEVGSSRRSPPGGSSAGAAGGRRVSTPRRQARSPARRRRDAARGGRGRRRTSTGPSGPPFGGSNSAARTSYAAPSIAIGASSGTRGARKQQYTQNRRSATSGTSAACTEFTPTTSSDGVPQDAHDLGEPSLRRAVDARSPTRSRRSAGRGHR